MSGFEIAGIVLGAFPLLLEGAENISTVFQDAKHWLRFEAEFERFLMEIEDAQIAYSQMLDLLLDPLEAILPHELETLKDSPSSPLWKDARVHNALKYRLQTKYYDWFMTRLRNMNKALQGLYKLLPIGKAYSVDSSDLESTLFRFRTSFSHEKDGLLAQIKTANESLYSFLQKSINIQHVRVPIPSKATSGISHMPSILDFQEHARLVLNSLQQNWTCTLGCLGRHPCSISVQDNKIKAFLSSGGNRKHVRFELRDTRETRCPTKPPSDPSSAIAHSEVTVLSHQVAKKRAIQRSKTEVPRSILSLTESTFSALSRPFTSDADVKPDGFERAAEKLRKRPKKVSFGNQTPPLRTSPAPISSQPPSPREDNLAIKNMCRTIAQECGQSCLGFFDLPDAKLYLHLEPHRQAPSLEAMPLNYFMGNTPERGVRLSLGHAVTKTVLHLGPAWVPDQWQQSSLRLLETPDPCPQPYSSLPHVPTVLQSTSTSTPTPAASKARSTLLRLGIILLELLFRDTLERQPFRETYLAGGKPNKHTDLCTAMEWQEKVEGEFGFKLAEAIDRCIRCSFGPPPDLGSSEFIREVWTLVVQPLEEFIRLYQVRS